MKSATKIAAVLLALLFLLPVFCACRSTPPAEDPIDNGNVQTPDDSPSKDDTPGTDQTESIYKSALTGLSCEKDDVLKRPVAVMIDNEVNYFSGQYSNLGLSAADLIFETNIESNGSGTRMMAVFSQNTLKNPDLEIGAVRSARPYFLQLAKMLDALYVHEGSSSTEDVLPSSVTDSSYYARPMLRRGYVDSYELGYDGKISYRPEEEIRSKLCVVSSAAVAKADNLLKHLNEMYPRSDYQNSDNRVFTFGTPDLSGAQAADSVRIRFSADNAFYTQSKFTYNATAGEYVRSQYLYQSSLGFSKNPNENDIASRDIKTGETLNFKNVFVLSTRQYACDRDYDGRPYHTKIDLVGNSGDGYYFTEGKVLKIKWTCQSDTSPIRFTTEDGKSLVVNPGKTFVNLINRDVFNKLEIK